MSQMRLIDRISPLHTLPWRALRCGLRNTGIGIYHAALHMPGFGAMRYTRQSPVPRTFKMWFAQRILGINRKAYWPVHFTSKVNQPQNIVVGIDTCPGYEPGCYIQGLGTVIIGDYTRIAQNVGIVSANHVAEDNSIHDKSQTVRIGDYCWLGMNSVVLPGVELGDFTVVGAGSVVTKSFPEGYKVIAGSPAKVIRELDPDKCVRNQLEHEFVGYIPAEQFEKFRAEKLWV